MFDDLRAAFKEALDNFNKELSRNQVPETVDKLLGNMKDEIAEEKAQVAAVQAQLEKTLPEIERSIEQAETARRREEMARKIDDQETATLAAQYAARHAGHRQVLEKKAAALREELAFREKTVEEMFARFHEAKTKRDALGATAGRTTARDSISDADDLFSNLDRMAEKIEGEEAAGQAAEAFGSIDLDEPSEYHIDLNEAPPEEMDADAALAELKRRMGKN
jgi:phage shock protein A